ncbi:MAG TPA: divergent polysaccharide deacetylase family protein [Stellaceae bacterium]|nr:divergent polysaccharide deacetylase family protein [Stellaceae bacterium]
MDQKLEDFVALLQRAAVAPPSPPRARPAPAAPRRRGAVPPRLPVRPLPAAGPRLLVNLGLGAAAVAVILLALWLPLPRMLTPRPAAPEVAAAPPQPSPQRVEVVTGKIALPFPVAEPDEQGEMTVPDPGEAPAPAPHATRLAALPPRPLPPARPGEPAWLRFAVPAPLAQGRPRIAIVIDDVGLDRKRSERAIALPAPLTLSFLPYANDLPRLAEEAHRAGHELLVHVPMEPMSRAEDMGPNGLAVNLGAEEVLRRLRWDLARFDGYVGINNHMGSRFTSDAASMTPVMEELKARGLLFLDSRTIGSSTGVELARKLGVPHAARDVFLDNEINAAEIAARLAEVEQVARRHGSAVAIGHPHDATIDQLAAWLASLPGKGFVPVPLSAIVKERSPEQGRGATG